MRVSVCARAQTPAEKMDEERKTRGAEEMMRKTRPRRNGNQRRGVGGEGGGGRGGADKDDMSHTPF